VPSVGSKPQSYKLQGRVASKYSEYTPEERVKVVEWYGTKNCLAKAVTNFPQLLDGKLP